MPTQRRSSRRGGKQDSTAATEVKQEDEISSYEKARVSRTQQPSFIFFFMTLSSFLYSMRRERIALRCIFICRLFQNAYCAQRCRHRLLLNKLVNMEKNAEVMRDLGLLEASQDLKPKKPAGAARRQKRKPDEDAPAPRVSGISCVLSSRFVLLAERTCAVRAYFSPGATYLPTRLAVNGDAVSG